MISSSIAAKLGSPTTDSEAAATLDFRMVLLDKVIIFLLLVFYFPASLLASKVPDPAPVPAPGHTAAPV